VLRGGLLWDDAAHVTRADLQSLRGLWHIWFDVGATQQYYPLLHSAFWVEHRLWGGHVLGYHLVNIALHALAACLLVRIVRRLELPGAWLAGLLFALHPLCVESVAWISEKSVLSGVFYLGAALAYLHFDESRKRSRYWVALGLFVLALLTKTVTATLPGALLVLLWWRRGKLEWKPLAPFFAIGAAAGLFTAWIERTLVGASGAETAVQRVLLAGRVVWFYAAKIVWPMNLTFFYPRWRLDPGVWWQWLFPIGAIAVGVVFWRLRNRGSLAAFLIFVGTLFPVLGFLDVYPFRYSYVADHFAYLATLAIVVPAAAFLSRWKAAYVVPAVLGILTFLQAADYRDEKTLYRATLARNPDAWLAHNNLGNLLPPAEAIPHFEEAIRLNPEFWEAHLSLGNALVDTRLQDAIAQYEIAARIAPRSERVHTNLGNALLQAGRTPEAIAQLEEALRLDPGNAEAHNDLGNAFSRLGRVPEAAAQYRAAIVANPDLAEAHNNLGRVLAQSGQWPDAIAEFQTATRLRPDSWSAHSNLGAALSHFPNRLPDAIGEYQAALRLRPDAATVHNNLGYALSKLPGRLPEAIAEYRTALRIDPSLSNAQANLADALRSLK
jgi:protein O-mannosyl-transferase